MSDVIRDITDYSMSEDYELLWDLAQKQSVVCEVDYDSRNNDPSKPIRDIAATRSHKHRDEIVVEVEVRGYGYIYATDKEDFLMQCRRSRLKFILPHIRKKERCIHYSCRLCLLGSGICSGCEGCKEYEPDGL
ncbi:MAG: hypothetical protein C4586_08670 [Anaerolineaceae bacterium]|nr:MAG: hypothetical protein C4586_08670 [Anaerolineaceae bacterium]